MVTLHPTIAWDAIPGTSIPISGSIPTPPVFWSLISIWASDEGLEPPFKGQTKWQPRLQCHKGDFMSLVHKKSHYQSKFSNVHISMFPLVTDRINNADALKHIKACRMPSNVEQFSQALFTASCCRAACCWPNWHQMRVHVIAENCPLNTTAADCCRYMIHVWHTSYNKWFVKESPLKIFSRI